MKSYKIHKVLSVLLPAKMEPIRQNKVARLIQKEMGEIFERNLRDLLPGTFITVTGAEISPDLSIAKIFFTVLGKIKPAEALEILMTNKTTIRKELSSRVRNQMRIVPDLRFHIDDSYDSIARIEELLKK
jgi:ribosome-binding factor A